MQASQGIKDFKINASRDAKANLKAAERITLALKQLKGGSGINNDDNGI